MAGKGLKGGISAREAREKIFAPRTPRKIQGEGGDSFDKSPVDFWLGERGGESLLNSNSI